MWTVGLSQMRPLRQQQQAPAKHQQAPTNAKPASKSQPKTTLKKNWVGRSPVRQTPSARSSPPAANRQPQLGETFRGCSRSFVPRRTPEAPFCNCAILQQSGGPTGIASRARVTRDRRATILIPCGAFRAGAGQFHHGEATHHSRRYVLPPPSSRLAPAIRAAPCGPAAGSLAAWATRPPPGGWFLPHLLCPLSVRRTVVSLSHLTIPFSPAADRYHRPPSPRGAVCPKAPPASP